MELAWRLKENRHYGTASAAQGEYTLWYWLGGSRRYYDTGSAAPLKARQACSTIIRHTLLA